MSEYVTRLREELVDAAAREQAGRRRRAPLRPRRVALVLAAAMLVVALVVAVSAIELRNDEKPVVAPPPGAALAYRATPVPGGDPSAAAQRSAAVLRARIAAAGITGATVTVTGDRVAVGAGAASHARIAALAVPGKLGIYDWEASVLGPDGRPAPRDAAVTGGPGAGTAAGVSQYEAVARAAKAPDAPGPPQFWLVDDAVREVVAGPRWTEDALRDAGPVPERARVVEVPGGVRVVRGAGGALGWYALAGGAALGNAEIAVARAAQDPGTGDPIVAFDFTSSGRTAFGSLTREIAHRGQAASTPGEDPMRAMQHLAIVLDDELAAVPFINFRETPDGIDGSVGAQIQGGLSGQRANEIATILNTGPMPATLVPVEPGSP